MSGGSVLGIFADLREEDVLRAISLCLLRIRSHGNTCKQIGAELGCCADTIENACNEKSMLKAAPLLRIATKYPEYWPMIEALWKFTPPKKRTVADKLRELLRDVESGRSV